MNIADQDKYTEPKQASRSQASSCLSPTNVEWLKTIFDDKAAANIGKTIHLSKKISIALYQDIIGDLATIFHVDIIGMAR
jgi:hypothetical protein